MSTKHATDDVDISGMSPPSLKRLREKIDNVLEDRGDQVGYIPGTHLASVDDTADDVREDEDDIAEELSKTLEAFKWNTSADMSLDSRLLGDKEVDELIATGTPSGFGCVKTATTKVDPEVRKAVEHTDHKLMKEALDAAGPHIPKLAKEVFGVDDVEIRPLKVNVYAPGGHFKPHVDTPVTDSRYLGSAVMEFATNRGRNKDSGTLQVYKQCRWNDGWRNLDTLAVFAPFVKHRVTEVKEGDVRVTVSFELFRNEPKGEDYPDASPPPEDEEEHENAAMLYELARVVKHYLLKDEKDCVGLVCHHQYSRHQNIYGYDFLLQKAIHKVGMSTMELNVIIDYSYNNDYNDNTEVSGKVYMPAGTYGDGGYPFYPMDSGGLLKIHENHEEGAEWTGNESRPDVHDMKYYARALMVSLPPKK
jgi:hypothetical protein